MATDNPIVSVCMATYNHEKFIARAIESVVAQKTDFPIELVIGEDCSKDSTRAICEELAARHPDIINLLPSDQNWGMSKNGIRIMSNCRGKYVAILDGDDYWADPNKLQEQVQFLEQNPDYGLVHTDAKTVDMDSNPVESDELVKRRNSYKDGYAFFTLLGSNNFITSCTALFRHSLLETPPESIEKYWYAYDLWYWLRISMQAKVHYLNKKTGCYRIHPGGITNTAQFKKGRKRNYHVLYDVIENFQQLSAFPLQPKDRIFLFRKIISLLYRKQGTLAMKIRILRLMPQYFPGLGGITRILLDKLGIRNSQSIASNPSHSS